MPRKKRVDLAKVVPDKLRGLGRSAAPNLSQFKYGPEPDYKDLPEFQQGLQRTFRAGRKYEADRTMISPGYVFNVEGPARIEVKSRAGKKQKITPVINKQFGNPADAAKNIHEDFVFEGKDGDTPVKEDIAKIAKNLLTGEELTLPGVDVKSRKPFEITIRHEPPPAPYNLPLPTPQELVAAHFK